MEELLKKIYENIIYYEKDTLKMDKRINAEIDKLIESYRNDFPESDIQTVKELIHQATFIAQKEGFRLGMSYMLKLWICLLSEKDIHEF